MSWQADYIAVLDPNDTSLDLTGCISLTNQSGASFRSKEMVMASMMQEDFRESSFFEYHIYDLQRKTTVKNNQTKQVRLLQSTGTAVEKRYLVKSQEYFFLQPHRSNASKQPVEVVVEFVNSKQNKLGMPLPAGTVRLYKKDADGSLQLAGEDRIEHTPNDEKVKLRVGEAFDVVAERVQIDYKQISSGLHESEWEITLRNHKKRGITVSVLESVPGNWKVISNSLPFKKESAFTIRFDMPVASSGEIKLKYRVQSGL